MPVFCHIFVSALLQALLGHKASFFFYLLNRLAKSNENVFVFILTELQLLNAATLNGQHSNEIMYFSDKRKPCYAVFLWRLLHKIFEFDIFFGL